MGLWPCFIIIHIGSAYSHGKLINIECSSYYYYCMCLSSICSCLFGIPISNILFMLISNHDIKEDTDMVASILQPCDDFHWGGGHPVCFCGCTVLRITGQSMVSIN